MSFVAARWIAAYDRKHTMSAGTQTDSTAPTAQDLVLRESTFALSPSVVEMPTWMEEAYSEDRREKMTPLHIIRPGVGKGKGNHLYEANMLEKNSGVFKGWKMYVDHLSPEARRAAGGLPRSIRDLGGVIAESYWDPTVPADPEKGHGQGAVIGWATPVPFVRELIETAPELVEASISANATGVHPTRVNGKRVWCVEGIDKKGSVDWVTEAGAGGRVVALMEAAYGQEETTLDLLENMSDEDFMSWVQEKRPHLLESDETAPAEGDNETTPAEGDTATTPAEGDKMGDITPEALQEALQTEDSKGVLNEALRPLVEAAVAEERELIRAEAKADANRRVELRDMRDEARTLVEASKLPEPLKEQVRSEFDLEDGKPSPSLNAITAKVDDEGKVEETAMARLREAVNGRIEEQRDLLGKINPTRVKGQGPASPATKKDGEDERKPGEGTFWGSLLQEAGVDPEKAYSGV